ncbi:sulfatase-like hydrolase/transferase [Verrucomicrobiaceae bacterium 227]
MPSIPLRSILTSLLLTGILPATEIDVILLAGQSNAAGRADAAQLTANEADSGVEYFYHVTSGSGVDFSSGGDFAPLAAVDNLFGPEFGLARQLKNDHEITNLAIIKRARGATNLVEDWSPGGSMYDPFIADCLTALNLITARGDTFKILGLAWHQGERDGVQGRTTAQYQADLHAFLANVRQDLHETYPDADFENLKFAIGEVASKPEISVAQQRVSDLDGGARFVPTADLNLFDGLHFDDTGQLTMGERMADTLIQLRDGVITENEPEVTTSALSGPWYTGSAGATAGVPSLSDRNSDTFTWGSGVESGGTSALRGMLWSYFPQQSLAPGDSLTLRFNTNYNDYGASAANANGFRFGLYRSNGSKLEMNIPNNNTDSAFEPSRGYGVMWAPADGGTSGLHARNADRNNPLSTNGSTTITSSPLGSGATSTGTTYAAELKVERDSANQLTVESSYNGQSLTSTTSVIAATDFDSIFILNTPQAGGVNSMALSGLEIEHRSSTEPLPEPVDLRISEIFYDGPTPFIELINIDDHEIDLGGLRFTRGIVFTLTSGMLAAGERITFNTSQFQGEPAPAETLRLEDRYQRVIDEVAYGGSPEWPSRPGHSLTLINAGNPNIDSNDPKNWRVSFAVGGSPGDDDSVDFTSWRVSFGITDNDGQLDSDGDGDPNYLEYAAGSNPLDAHSRAVTSSSSALTYTRNPAAEDASLKVQTSRDLHQWSEGEVDTITQNTLGTGQEEITAGSTGNIDPKLFYRLAARPGDQRPNVLFIAVDDLRPQLKAYGADGMITPNMDRLASEGRLFNRHYVQCPTCGASRYAMMTSNRPRTGAASSNGAFGSLFQNTNDPQNPNSLPQAFRFAGYKTVGLGKLSHEPDGGASEMPGAWDEAYMTSGIWGSPTNAFFAYANGVTRTPGVSLRTEIGVAADGITSLEDNDYPDGLMAGEAIRRLREFKTNDERFFFGLGFFKPHLPFSAPKKYWDLYDREALVVPARTTPSGVNNSLTLSGNGEFIGNYGGTNTIDEAEAKLSIHGYYACVSYVDAQIGKVLDELDALDLTEETIVVLWGDHGWHLGEHTVWGKHTTLEESLRSTLIVRAPYQARRGIATDCFAESIDLYPTLCELCQIPIPDSVEGRSFAPALLNPAARPKDFALGLWRKGGTDGYSIRTERYRLVRWGNDPGNPTQIDLFDYQTDPEGKQNAAASQPAVVTELLERISEL